MALLHRIKPTASHNDRNRLGRILSRLNRSVPSYQDNINPETHELSPKSREPIGFPLRISVLDGNVLSFYVAKLAQSCLKWLETVDSVAGSVDVRYPICGTFFGCYADTEKQSAKSIAKKARPKTLALLLPVFI